MPPSVNENIADYPGGNPVNHPPGTRSVLVADDNADYRKLLKSLFTAHSYNVTEAADGRQALLGRQTG